MILSLARRKGAVHAVPCSHSVSFEDPLSRSFRPELFIVSTSTGAALLLPRVSRFQLTHLAPLLLHYPNPFHISYLVEDNSAGIRKSPNPPISLSGNVPDMASMRSPFDVLEGF